MPLVSWTYAFRTCHSVPSLILQVDEQIDLMRSAGLRMLAIQEVLLEDIADGQISNKLVLPEIQCDPILRGYLARNTGIA